ncbi:MAG: hypothetical protein FH759_04710 [Sediminimonas qiaohouensis]|uniref:Uncharacterized protein n=1 Tax=Sediminimonas qiaohouensis TaxID=552061 RepID=A0A7C9HB33_9RHOB|nr:hypothetical protein [Sediminimonas qiaohouensis]MTJ03985.1 hypothetical protein [Sediminimonas qiaohouensis]
MRTVSIVSGRWPAGEKLLTMNNSLTGFDARLRQSVIDRRGVNLWKHGGSDSYSQLMDAGARHQNKADCRAILDLIEKDQTNE